MEFFRKDRTYFFHLMIQASVAIVFMWLVLFALDNVAASRIIWAAGASTLASSAYIVFCAPKAVVAKPQKIMGAYIIAILCGEFMRLLANFFCRVSLLCPPGDPSTHVFEVAAAISVGLALLLMVIFKSEHPPAAGLAVVTVLDVRSLEALGIILGAAAVLTLIRIIFRHKLCNLI